jgi:hypothetical protein
MISGASTAGSTLPTEPQVCCRNIATTAISIRVKSRASFGLTCSNPNDTRRQRQRLLRLLSRPASCSAPSPTTTWLARHPCGPSTSPQPPPKAQCLDGFFASSPADDSSGACSDPSLNCRQPLIASSLRSTPLPLDQGPRQEHRCRQTWAPSVGFCPPDSPVVNSVDRFLRRYPAAAHGPRMCAPSSRSPTPHRSDCCRAPCSHSGRLVSLPGTRRHFLDIL